VVCLDWAEPGLRGHWRSALQPYSSLPLPAPSRCGAPAANDGRRDRRTRENQRMTTKGSPAEFLISHRLELRVKLVTQTVSLRRRGLSSFEWHQRVRKLCGTK